MTPTYTYAFSNTYHPFLMWRRSQGTNKYAKLKSAIESKGNPNTNFRKRLIDLADNFKCDIIFYAVQQREMKLLVPYLNFLIQEGFKLYGRLLMRLRIRPNILHKHTNNKVLHKTRKIDKVLHGSHFHFFSNLYEILFKGSYCSVSSKAFNWYI